MDYQYLLGAFFLAAAIFGVVLLLVLVAGRGIDLSRKLLIGLLVVMILVLVDAVFISLKIYRVFPHGLFLFSSLWLLVPALMFLYTKVYSLQKHRLGYRDLWHLMPVAIYLLMSYEFYGFSAETKIHIGDYVYAQSGPPSWFSLLFFGQNYLYLLLVYHLRKSVPGPRKKWLQSFWYIWLGVVIFDTLLSLISLRGVNVSLYKDISILTYSFQAYFIAFYVLRQPRLFFAKTGDSLEKYGSTTVSEEQLHHLAKAAESVMQAEQFYLKKDLRQHHLATRLQINTVVLSQVLDAAFQQNFNEWINRYRIAHASTLIAEGFLNQYSVDALADASGYASKVSFYRNFRKVTGMTPLAYKETLEESR